MLSTGANIACCYDELENPSGRAYRWDDRCAMASRRDRCSSLLRFARGACCPCSAAYVARYIARISRPDVTQPGNARKIEQDVAKWFSLEGGSRVASSQKIHPLAENQRLECQRSLRAQAARLPMAAAARSMSASVR